MRKLIATVFNCSLDGLLADEGTEFWNFCFDQPEIVSPTTRGALCTRRGQCVIPRWSGSWRRDIRGESPDIRRPIRAR